MRKSLWIAGFLILALVACRPPGEAQVGSEAKEQQQPKAPAAAPQPAPDTRRGAPTGSQVLNRLWDDPPTLDPALTGDTTSAGLVVEIFSGLISLDRDLRLVPDLAERWDVSPDGKTYTFFLRKNARFHNGKEVTADDFKYSMERAADPRTESPVADTYLGDIVGVREKLSGKAKEISGVKVIDKNTLQIIIDAPKAYFLAKLTYPTAYVVDRTNVEGRRNWTFNPNGTGPFKLKEWVIGERIILERNELFYLEPPKLDRVNYILRGGIPMTLYENGEIDITGVGLADIDRVRSPQDPLNKDLKIAPPGFDISYIGFNVNQPPFDDPKVRQALSLAVNKELIANQVFGDLVVPAYGILPPGFPGYSGRVTGLKHDPEKAKSLLAESKYKSAANFPRIVMTVPGTGGSAGLDIEAIMEMWKQTLGVRVEIQQTDWATYLDDLHKKKFQIFAGIGWQADYPDPENFLDVLFHSKSTNNNNSYKSQEVDTLLEQARVERNVTARLGLYEKVEQMIVNDAPWIPLWYQGERVVLIKPYVKDYKLSPLIIPKLRYVYIEGR